MLKLKKFLWIIIVASQSITMEWNNNQSNISQDQPHGLLPSWTHIPSIPMPSVGKIAKYFTVASLIQMGQSKTQEKPNDVIGFFNSIRNLQNLPNSNISVTSGPINQTSFKFNPSGIPMVDTNFQIRGHDKVLDNVLPITILPGHNCRLTKTQQSNVTEFVNAIARNTACINSTIIAVDANDVNVMNNKNNTRCKLTLYDNEDNLMAHDINLKNSRINGTNKLSIEQYLFNSPVKLQISTLNPMEYISFFKNITETQLPQCNEAIFTMEFGSKPSKKLSVCLNNTQVLYQTNCNNTQIVSYNSKNNSTINSVGLMDGEVRYIASEKEFLIFNSMTIFNNSMAHWLDFKFLWDYYYNSDLQKKETYSKVVMCIHNNQSESVFINGFDVNKCIDNQYNNTDIFDNIYKFILNMNDNSDISFNDMKYTDVFNINYRNNTAHELLNIYPEGIYNFNWRNLFKSNKNPVNILFKDDNILTNGPKLLKLLQTQNVNMNNSNPKIFSKGINGKNYYPGLSFSIAFYVALGVLSLHTLVDLLPKIFGGIRKILSSCCKSLEDNHISLSLCTSLLVFNSKIQILVSWLQILIIGISILSVKNKSQLFDHYNLENIIWLASFQLGARVLNFIAVLLYRCKNTIEKYNGQSVIQEINTLIKSKEYTNKKPSNSCYNYHDIDLIYNTRESNHIAEILKQNDQLNIDILIGNKTFQNYSKQNSEPKIEANDDTTSQATDNRMIQKNSENQKKNDDIQLLLQLFLIKKALPQSADIKGEPFIDQHTSLMSKVIYEIKNYNDNNINNIDFKNDLFNAINNMRYTRPIVFNNIVNIILEGINLGFIGTLYANSFKA